MKEQLGREIAKRVKSGEIIGVGTGTTVNAALDEIARRVTDERLSLTVVPSSYQTALRCQAIGLTVLSSLYNGEITWAFDGADEIDPELQLIKGRGGAMLQEKILAAKSRRFVVIADESKLVSKLCEKYPIPIEVIPEALYPATRGLQALGAAKIEPRQAVSKHGPVITERGNLILDVLFEHVTPGLEERLKQVVGVVESGLFVDYTDEAIIAKKAGLVSLLKSSSGAIREQRL